MTGLLLSLLSTYLKHFKVVLFCHAVAESGIIDDLDCHKSSTCSMYKLFIFMLCQGLLNYALRQMTLEASCFIRTKQVLDVHCMHFINETLGAKVFVFL